jgi:hypothetical protein
MAVANEPEWKPVPESPLDEPIEPANYLERIEAVIASLQETGSAKVNHSGEGYLWKFRYGTVDVFVQLTGLGEEDTLTIWAPVLKLPAKDEAKLMRQLLEMNWADTFEARFGIFQDEVMVLTSRTLAGLSATEIARAVTVVANVADDNDDVLKFQFGAS